MSGLLAEPGHKHRTATQTCPRQKMTLRAHKVLAGRVRRVVSLSLAQGLGLEDKSQNTGRESFLFRGKDRYFVCFRDNAISIHPAITSREHNDLELALQNSAHFPGQHEGMVTTTPEALA